MPTFLDVLESARTSVVGGEEPQDIDDLVSGGVGIVWINRFITQLEKENPGICAAFLSTGKLYTVKQGDRVVLLPDDLNDSPVRGEMPVVGKVGEYQTLVFWRNEHGK